MADDPLTAAHPPATVAKAGSAGEAGAIARWAAAQARSVLEPRSRYASVAQAPRPIVGGPGDAVLVQ